MSDVEDYRDLMALRSHPGFQKLQALWTQDAQEIMKKLDQVTKLSGKDQPLRYHAGQWNGFNRAIARLDLALDEMGRVVENTEDSLDIEATIAKIRGDKS